MISTGRVKDPTEELFLEEEFKADKLNNNIRFVIVLILAFIAFFKGSTEETASVSFIITAIAVTVAISYTILLYIIYRRNFYHPIMKFISTTIDVTLIVVSIYAYKFEQPEKYATIYFLARFSILYIFIILTIIRYNFRLSFYVTLIALVEYVVLVVFQNEMNGFQFTFIGSDGMTYMSELKVTEIYLKVFYLIIIGFVSGLIAIYFRGIVTNSLKQEKERNKLELKNKVTEIVNSENKKYLDNISNGLLLIDKNYIILDQYSKFLTSIFETDDIAEKPFINLIYPDKINQIQERRELSEFLSLLFSNATAEVSMIMDVNPIKNKTIKINNKNGETIKEKIISATFHRIMNNDLIENIMVIIEDVTERVNAEKQLRVEKIRHETEIEIISAILKIDSNTLTEFLEESDEILNNVEVNINNMQEERVINDFFRGMHSLKGAARSLNFLTISRLSHKIEDTLSQIRDSKVNIDYEIKLEIRSLVNDIFNNLNLIKEIKDKFKNFSSTNTEEKKNNLNSFISSIKQMTTDIAKELDKDIELKAVSNIDNFPLLNQQIKNSVIHLIRNAADHGIEDKFERLTSGKPEKSSIIVSFKKDNNNYIISVKDDGKGIDFDLVRKKALEKKLIDYNDTSKSKLLNVLFMPAFSSKDKVSNISGRGVGLDVVKDVANKLNGRISVNTEKDKGTRITLTLPVN